MKKTTMEHKIVNTLYSDSYLVSSTSPQLKRLRFTSAEMSIKRGLKLIKDL